jgi:hypothetical protein
MRKPTVKTRKRLCLLAIIPIFLLCVFLSSLLTACSKEPEVQEKKPLPYGATLTDNAKDYKIRVQYDNRFLNPEQIAVLADYYYSFQTEDFALFKASVLPAFDEFSKEMHDVSAEEWFKESSSEATAAIGKGWVYTLCDIVDATEERDISGIDTRLEQLDSFLTKQNKESISDKITKTIALKVNTEIMTNGKKGGFNGETVFLFEYEGKFYVFI